MSTKQQFFSYPRFCILLCGLTLAVALLFTPMGVGTALAQDSTPPSISYTIVGATGNNGLYISDVTISWNVVDNESPITSTNGCETQTVTNDIDRSFACSASSAGGKAKVGFLLIRNATAPIVTVTGVSNGTTYILGSVPTAGCSTTATGSSVASQATLTISGGNPNGTGSFTATCSGAVDVAGYGTAPVSVSYTVVLPPDTTPPIILPIRVGTLGNNNWYVSDVNLTWSVVDPESTVTSLSGCEPRNVTNDTVLVTFNCSATSLGGTESDTAAIKRDATVPTISAAATEPPHINGWYNSNVTVHFTCSDATSGVTNCPADQVLSNEGAAVASTAQTITDLAGNTSVPSNIVTVQLDKSAPEVTVTSVNDGADYPFDGVPTAACVTTDALSGVAGAATLSISGGNGDGTGTFTATCSGAVDNADNSSAPVSISYTVLPPPDTTAPVISPQLDGTLGYNGWYTSDVTVSWSVVDDESTITDQNGCDAVDVTSDTDGITFTCAATSAGGSNNESVTVKRDTTAPTISAATTSSPNGNGWYNSAVTVTFTCADALSGVDSCPTDETLSDEGSAVSSTAQTTTDLAGNTSEPSNIVTVQLDRTPPVVTVTGVSDGASYTLGSVPTPGCETSDALSGVATEATLSVTGGNADGSGSFTATCSGAEDNAGNSSSASVNYSVSYNWSGFFAPVENLPTVNTVNAGQAIPIKFSLGGDFGLDIFATGYPASQSVSCSGSGGDTNPIEETGTPGNSSLHYAPTTQTYTYNWKTDKSWGGSCRQLIVKLIDGSEQTALFQFKGRARSAASEADEAVLQQIFLPVVSR